MDSASSEDGEKVRATIEACNPGATIVTAESEVTLDDPKLIKGKRVLVVEDGPTLTHGEMKFGAGVVAVERFDGGELVDPRPWLQGTLKETFEKYPDIGTVLPAMGYSDQQVADLEATINSCDCDVVVSATPIDLTRLITINKPVDRVAYGYKDLGAPTLESVIREKLS
ncbi:MAG: hypothetical protein GY700_08080 [Propionibacteriaceae bacterium]|nr:hypothetical protein [Propionibacteriaceae bacterium]